MSNVIRDGDTSSHGGIIHKSQDKVTANGKPICVDGDLHVCPIPFHGTTQVHGTARTSVNGKAVVIDGNTAGCGAVMQSSIQKVSSQ